MKVLLSVVLIVFATVLTTVWLSGWRPRNTAVTSAVPPVRLPIGPLPGPGEHPPFPDSPYEGDRVALREGRRLFVAFNCEGCHGGHGGGGMGPSLRDVTWIYGGGDAEIFDSIAEGRAYGMPAWGLRLPEEEIWKLVSYIKSMRTELEPSPPTPLLLEDLPARQNIKRAP